MVDTPVTAAAAEPAAATSTPAATPTPEPAPAGSVAAATPSDSIAAEAPPKAEETAPAPIKYEPFKLPEGVEFDQEGLTKATGLFSELKLDQAGAQRLVDMYVQNTKDAIAAAEAANTKAWTDTRQAWTDQIKADKELGGTNLPIVKSTIAKAIDSIAGPEAAAVREALQVTGADNNPAVVKLLFRMGKALTEGTHVSGDPARSKPAADLATRLYGPDGPKTTIGARPTN